MILRKSTRMSSHLSVYPDQVNLLLAAVPKNALDYQLLIQILQRSHLSLEIVQHLLLEKLKER